MLQVLQEHMLAYIWSSGSNDTIPLLAIDHAAAKKLKNNMHKHTIIGAGSLMKSRRVLEQSGHRQTSQRVALQ